VIKSLPLKKNHSAMQKRHFLKSVSALGLFSIISSNRLRAEDTIANFDNPMFLPTDQYTLPPLDYGFNALEPHIDAKTMEIHHDRHHNTYVTNLNKEMSTNVVAAKLTLEQLFASIDKQSPAIRNNGGGHYNHSLFWKLLTGSTGTLPTGDLAKAITASFKDLNGLKEQMNKAGAARFGSGWAWLVSDEKGKLSVGSTANQDNPLMNTSEIKGHPILGIDVWEHAYYLKYQNKRAEYLVAIWNVINWDEVGKRYVDAKAAMAPKK
jgi:superoxide dismutase, Fe-Mn family